MANSEETLGEHLRQARLDKDLGLRELAKELGITPSYLSDIESDRRVPSEDVLRVMSERLDLDFDELMARAARFGEDAERYLKRHPAAAALFRKIADQRLSDDQLKQLLSSVDRLGKKGKRGR
jgi:transcriptional regulator with XRE-family HTH domain